MEEVQKIFPRAKRVSFTPERFCFSKLALFTVGDGGLFESFLRTVDSALPLETVDRGEANVVLSVSRVFSSREEYALIRVKRDGIEIRCRDNAGARNAAAILYGLLKREGTGYSLPVGTVEDYPDTAYRAMMLESSGRAWIPLERLYRHVTEMARARMNVLVFNFMEDPGCTVALDSCPMLHGYGEEDLKYTKDEIRALIDYAARLGIEICPFIEVISHATELILSRGIGCPGDAPPHMFSVCVGKEETFDVIEEIIAEIAELFPSDVIHIGADEYDMSAVTPRTVHWDLCPHCRALSAEKGYTTFRELFFYAVERVNRIVNRFGKVSMMWNADLKPGEIPDEITRNIVIHYYRADNTLGKEKHFGLLPDGYAEDGFSVLNSYYPDTYMDLPEYMKAERLNAWSPSSMPRVSERNRASVIGGCCCAWEDYPHFLRTVSPAILLFADRLINADGDPAPYDDGYGTMMTYALFGDALPEGMNVFRAVGDVLPPLKNDVLFHKRRLVSSPSELREIRDALVSLKETGGELATAYAEIAEAALQYRESLPETRALLTQSVRFEG